MSAVVLAGKRLLIALYMWLSFLQVGAMSTAVLRWQSTWWTNRQSIVTLTVVNTAITTGSEFITRTVSAPATKNPHQTTFFVTTASGSTTIHRQSLINIWMTIFASLLGGPVFFLHRRLHRFLFFISFGMFNSVLSQSVCAALIDGVWAFAFSRLIFDFFYTGTFKFLIFEYGRPWIIRFIKSYSSLGVIRVSQDMTTTLIRVSLLNFFGFKG